MAVYKNRSRISYSPPLLPDLEKVRSGLAYEVGMNEWGHEYTTLDPTSLVYQYDPDPFLEKDDRANYDHNSLRTDLVLLIHSHPSSSLSNTAKDLRPCPSPEDFFTYEKWQRLNPNLIEGILGVNKHLGKIALLFYRQSETQGGFQPSYMQALSEEDRQSSNLTRSYMLRSGLNIAYADYSLTPTRIISDSSEVTEELFA